MLGLLGLRIFEAGASDVADVGEEHGHRVLRVVGKGTKIVLVPLPPAVGRAIDQAIGNRTTGPILLNRRRRRMDRHRPPNLPIVRRVSEYRDHWHPSRVACSALETDRAHDIASGELWPIAQRATA